METKQTPENMSCPFTNSAIVISKSPPKSHLNTLFPRLKNTFSSPYKRIINTYYCRHPIKFYSHVGQLVANTSKPGSYQDIVKVPTLVGDLFFVTDPAMIKALLQYPRLDQGELLSEGRQLRVIADALGKFRLNKDKSDMKPKRSVLANLLTNSEKYFPVMFTVVDELMEKWRLAHEPIVITQDISEFTVRIFLKSIMKYEGPVAPIVPILEEQIDLLGKRLSYRTPTTFTTRFSELRNQLMSYLYPDHKPLTTQNEYTARLSGYIDQHHKDHENDAFATGVNSGTLAGYLAPNPAFIALVYELGKHSEWQSKLKEEWLLANAAGLSRDDYIQSEDTLLHAAVHEVLRLHPSQPFLFRNVDNDFMINQQHLVTKGSQLLIDIYHSLRDTSRWGNDAALFNPMRFVNNPELYHRPFLVYSTGPNNCTGQIFSRQTMKIFLQAMCANFKWSTLNENVKHRFHFALTQEQDIVIKILELGQEI